jgi:thiol-disulfide isomerase/thioredoxin
MKTFFATHNNAFRAEWLKMRHTGMFWLCLGSSLFIPLIQTLAGIFLNTGLQEDAWQRFVEGSLSGFTGFFYPLFLVIFIGRIVYLEHRNDTWKVLETQPVSRLALFLVKMELALLIALFCLWLLLAFSLCGGLVVSSIRPDQGFQKSGLHWNIITQGLLRYWVASFGLLAVQYYLSLLIRSFAWPMIIGLVGIIAGGVMVSLGVWNWFPYNAINQTANAFKGSQTGQWLLPHEWISVLWMLLMLTLGYQLYTRRRFVSAHIKGIRGMATGLGIIAFALIVWKLAAPVVLQRYAGTVLDGEFNTERPIKQVVLLRGPAMDTMLSGPVVNGRFHLSSATPIAQGIYELRAGSQSLTVYFGTNDSLHISLTSKKYDYKVQYGGNRAAENEFLTNNRAPDLGYMMRFSSRMDSREFSTVAMGALENVEKSVRRFHTVDNLRPADDFVDLYRKLTALAVLRQANIEYPKSFALYHPNDTLRYSESLEKLRDEIGLNDAFMLHQPGYLEYVSEYLRSKAARSGNRDSALGALTDRLVTNNEVKEAFYMSLFAARLQRIPDSSARTALVAMAMPMFTQPVYRRALEQQLKRLNSVMRGMPAPEFASEAGNGTAFRLDRFRGRFVVVDVWATWCGPCKTESPYFEEMAERFTDEKLLFVSLSVDEDRDAWRREVGGHAASILQLHVPDATENFLAPYGIESIPRFLLIDPNGRIVNANMPPPSDPEFAGILQREVPFAGRY